MFLQGRHNSGKLLAVRSIRNELGFTRYAYSIPKRVGMAVLRNRIRRRLREILRSLPLQEGYDVVLVVRQDASQASFFNLRSELMLLLKRAKLLDAPASPRARSSR